MLGDTKYGNEKRSGGTFMRGKIDKGGTLHIKRSRASREIRVQCPLGHAYCNDSCALFGEPDYNGKYMHIDSNGDPEELSLSATLTLCHKTLEFFCLVDERCYGEIRKVSGG